MTWLAFGCLVLGIDESKFRQYVKMKIGKSVCLYLDKCLKVKLSYRFVPRETIEEQQCPGKSIDYTTMYIHLREGPWRGDCL